MYLCIKMSVLIYMIILKIYLKYIFDWYCISVSYLILKDMIKYRCQFSKCNEYMLNKNQATILK